MNKGRRTGITMNKKLGSTLIAMTIIIFMLFLTLGMFTKNFGGSASAGIASAQTSIQGDDKSLTGVSDDGSIDAEEDGTYTFYVKNTDKDGNNVSGVSMKYSLTVDTEQIDNSDVNVDYELYKVTTSNGNEVQTKLENWDAEKGFTDNNLPTLQHGTQQVDKYILKFTPDKEGQFKFKVHVKSEQIE